jgi:hypothetical protein
MRFQLRLLATLRRILRLVCVDEPMQGDDANSDRVMAMALLKFPEGGWVKAIEGSLQSEHVISSSLVVCGTLISCRHLERLFFLVADEGKNQLEPSVFRHFNSVFVEEASLGYSLCNPQANRAVVVSWFEYERDEPIDGGGILHPFQQRVLVC